MLTVEQILEALRKVEEPELKNNLVALNLVRNIRIFGDRVALTVMLFSEDSPHRESLREEVIAALRQAGAEEVEIEFDTLSAKEQEALAERIRREHQEKVRTRRAAGRTPLQQQNQVPSLLSKDSPTEFISVASGKGGVGKSTVAVNLAVALAREGKRVGVIDADIYGFSVPDMMGIEERPAVVDKTIYPVERFGVKVISMGFFVEENAPVIWRGPMLGKMLRNFFQEVDWGELDYMILDLPPGTGDVALDVHQMLPQSKELLVTTPHATAAFVAARAGAMAIHTKHEILGVVENMAYYQCSSCGNRDYIFGRDGGEKLAEELNTELLIQIPLGAPDNGNPEDPDFSPSIYEEGSPTGQLYRDLARKVLDRT
ncbi:P-loop NTPase [Kroppenstedtia eburnea]|uniref:Iron-sulfur cluster carrier protein n=1 Tax=Kroppenstedtia eburnea TaxID=714067 RepID=A0A1N7N2H8_9BACL|nr:Mrp/NBP35 family ATP-binding protein [Kroppenstedtia eburnea]EGK09782.1 mrp/Nbp35 family ATP-binding protein [Desmospora sp. 8437]QKI80795.1 P-loop NTPase [Kroppenstedtia eburnea]SIS92339.1 ATP-binding protein involved in chromosome partitioning [Kroppenstedtia eburnea]